MNTKTRVLQALNITSFIGVVVINALATTLPINGMDTGQLSDLYPNLFVPSGLTFSIWGIIYLLLLGFSVYQARKHSAQVVERIGWLFLLSSLANIGWILAWHYLLVGLSFVVMLILLGSLIALFLRLGIGSKSPNQAVSPSEKWFVHVPFSVYLGWITVATIANATALLVHLGWNGFGISEAAWTVVVIAAALGITISMLLTKKSVAFSLVVVWALAGIVIKRAGEAADQVWSVILAAAIAGVLILITIPIVLLIKKKE